MKILFSGEDFYPPVSGGDISVLTLFEELKKEHEVEAICTGKKTETTEINGIKIYRIKTFLSKFPSWVRRYFLNKMWVKLLDNHLRRIRYDLVITQSVLAPASITAAKKNKIPTLLFIRSYEHFCLSHLRDVSIPEKHNCLKYASWKYKIQYPFFKIVIKWHKNALKNSDFLAANSKFMQSIAKKWYGIDSEVIYPFIKLEDYKSKRTSPEYITLVRPDERKGVKTFIKIVDMLPKKKFLAVGKGEEIKEMKRRKNIKYIPWINNMKEIYSKTKILLAPSIWFEPFGRVAIEAMCNGIPCIVSNKGGLPEAVGDAGIVISPFDITAWVSSINKLENDEIFYKKLSKKSKKVAKKFNLKSQYIKFEKILRKVL